MRKNADLLRHIVRYCNEINEAVEHFGNSFEALQASSSYKNATAMCIFQIGEISVHLSDDFKTENHAVPWKQIRGMRNIAAHNYGEFSLKQLWVRSRKMFLYCARTAKRFCGRMICVHRTLLTNRRKIPRQIRHKVY